MENKIHFCQDCQKEVVTELEKEYTLQKVGRILCWNCLKRRIVLEELGRRDDKKETIEEAIKKLQEENVKVTAFERVYGGEKK